MACSKLLVVWEWFWEAWLILTPPSASKTWVEKLYMLQLWLEQSSENWNMKAGHECFLFLTSWAKLAPQVKHFCSRCWVETSALMEATIPSYWSPLLGDATEWERVILFLLLTQNKSPWTTSNKAWSEIADQSERDWGKPSFIFITTIRNKINLMTTEIFCYLKKWCWSFRIY